MIKSSIPRLEALLFPGQHNHFADKLGVPAREIFSRPRVRRFIIAPVEMLLRRKAPLEVKNMYDGTVLGQALWSAFNEPQSDHLKIIDALIAAGAEVQPDWNRWITELRQ